MNQETKTRILDAAERLFAQDGIKATSLRAITEAAAANLAAVNYHFGSKEALVHAVYGRRLKPLNERRLRMLDETIAADPNDLAGILRAFALPMLETALQPPQEGSPVNIGSLLVRLYTEPAPLLERGFNEVMACTAARFVDAVHHVLPHLPERVLYWRVHFCVGCLAHTMNARQILSALSHGIIDPNNVEQAFTQMLPFLKAGLTAPSEA